MKALIVTLALLPAWVCAQPSQQVLDSIRKYSAADHAAMMEQLGIASLRPGANGSDRNAPNAVNYDEGKANPFPQWPGLLISNDGKTISTANDWWKKRRPEIVEAFDNEIYGRLPKNLPAVNWIVESNIQSSVGKYATRTKRLSGRVNNSSYPAIQVNIDLTLTVPENAKGKVPVIIEFSFPGFRPSPQTQGSWQEQLIEKGYGFAVLIPTSIQADNGAGLRQGIIGLCNKGAARKPHDWGSLRAWAWGASKVLDYFQTDPWVDTRYVGIEGHSRYGKAAAVTMAYDPRFAFAYVSSSGEAGLKPHRRNFGEIVENVAGSGEYHWMAGNFIKYAGPKNWNDLPVDAHHLLALSAPRPVFVGAGAQGDEWCDPRGMFMATAAASPVYELLGKQGLGTTQYPAVEQFLGSGDLAFRVHPAGHTPAPNWPYVIQFVQKYFPTLPAADSLPTLQVPGLKDVFASYFPIGVAVSPRSLQSDEAPLIVSQFNSVTPENAMKMGPIHPQPDVYNWRDADSIVAFAVRNGMRIRGHNLCWHQQAPGWMFKNADGSEVSKEVLLARLKDHITVVVSRYKGKIYAWDVVNEAISDNPAEQLRNSEWLRICGPEFIEKAFEYAHAADPDALLFYNDYNTERPEKTERVYKLLKELREKRVPIHGVGLQAHWSIFEPSRQELEGTIEKFASLGLQIHFTEMDISIYKWEKEDRAKLKSDIDDFTPALEQQQIEKYKMAFDVFRKYKENITSITFWNVSDRSTWLDNYPVRGRKNYPLLFDTRLRPKKVFYEVIK